MASTPSCSTRDRRSPAVPPAGRRRPRLASRSPQCLRVVPDGLEPSLPGCRPGVVAAGPRDLFVLNAFAKWTAPDGRFLRVMRLAAEAVGLEPTSGSWRTPVFETGPSSGRMTSVIDLVQVAGAGIEPAASWFRVRRHYQQQLPRSVFCPLINERPSVKTVRGEGFEPSSPASKAGSLPLADPRARRFKFLTKCPAGVEPASPAWKAGTSAARPRAQSCQFLRRKQRESNPQASDCSTPVFETGPSSARWLP